MKLNIPNKGAARGSEPSLVDKTVFLLRCGGRYAIRKRPDEGLLAGLWEFPSVDRHLAPEEVVGYLREPGFTAAEVTKLPDAKHIFTHIEWHMLWYEVRVREEIPSYVWADVGEIHDIYSIPSAFKAFLALLQ